MRTAAATGLVAGIATQGLWPVLPMLPVLALAVLSAVSAVVVARRRAAGAAWCAMALAGIGAGMLHAGHVAGDVLQARLPPVLEGRALSVEGEVRTLRVHADGSATVMLAVRELPWLPQRRGHWQLRLYSHELLPWQAGERWRLPVRLKRPHAARNPGGADFERWLFSERVVATGTVKAGEGMQRLASARGLAAWRLRLLASTLPLFGAGAGDVAGDEAARFARAVLPALVLDERGLMSSGQWRILANTGTAHLVAISGLHVALLWGAVFWLSARIMRRRTGSLRFHAVPVLGALACAAGYAALAGMPLPAARAVLMLAALSLLMLRDGTAPAWRILLLATAVILLLDPLAIHAAGFWLSHGAVAALLLLNDLRQRARRPATGPLRGLQAARLLLHGQLALSVLMAPLLLGLFGTASVSGVVANLPAIPLVNLLVLPLALGGFALAPFLPGLADPLLDAALFLLACLWRFLVLLDGQPLLSPLMAHGIPAVAVVLLLAAVAAFVLSRSLSLRLAVLLLAVLAWPVAPAVPAGAARICVLDVGQGLAVSARTAHHAFLYDTGPAWSAESDAGASVVVPALHAQGVRQLDLLVLGHHDLDHTGGSTAVVTAMRPREIVTGDARSWPAAPRCDRERRWQFDGVGLVLFPGDGEGSDNDRSCVLRVAAGPHALLVPGDIGRRRELALAGRYRQRLAADVLVAAHHGSRSSSTHTFLYRVAPSSVIFSAGYRNRFGHPHPEVVRRVAGTGAGVSGTAADGAVCFLLAPDTPPQPAGTRHAGRRFWHE